MSCSTRKKLVTTINCHHCNKPIRKIQCDILDIQLPSEISISYYKEDKVGHLRFHPECFEQLAGVEYLELLTKNLY